MGPTIRALAGQKGKRAADPHLDATQQGESANHRCSYGIALGWDEIICAAVPLRRICRGGDFMMDPTAFFETLLNCARLGSGIDEHVEGKGLEG